MGFKTFHGGGPMTAAGACCIACAFETIPGKASRTRGHLDIILQHHLLNNVTRQWGQLFSPGTGSTSSQPLRPKDMV